MASVTVLVHGVGERVTVEPNKPMQTVLEAVASKRNLDVSRLAGEEGGRPAS
jgi:hypothetical protein